jgi:hypothetical protein
MNLSKNEVMQAIAEKTKMEVVDLKTWRTKKAKDGHTYFAIAFDGVKKNAVYEGSFYAQPKATRKGQTLDSYIKTSVSPVRKNEAKTARYRKTGSSVR